MISCWLLRYVVFVISNLPILKAVQNNIALPYGKQLWYKPHFNTLKNECTNLYEFDSEDILYQTVEEFAYVDYNHVRPHSFNNYRTPYETRITA